MINKRGLASKEATEKLSDYGYNEIKELLHISPFRILLRQIKKNFAVAALVSLTTIIVFDIWKRIKGDLTNENQKT